MSVSQRERDLENIVKENEITILSLDSKLQNLCNASLFSLGWIIGQENINAPPALQLAKAIKNAGISNDYVEWIIMNNVEREVKK